MIRSFFEGVDSLCFFQDDSFMVLKSSQEALTAASDEVRRMRTEVDQAKSAAARLSAQHQTHVQALEMQLTTERARTQAVVAAAAEAAAEANAEIEAAHSAAATQAASLAMSSYQNSSANLNSSTYSISAAALTAASNAGSGASSLTHSTRQSPIAELMDVSADRPENEAEIWPRSLQSMNSSSTNSQMASSANLKLGAPIPASRRASIASSLSSASLHRRLSLALDSVPSSLNIVAETASLPTSASSSSLRRNSLVQLPAATATAAPVASVDVEATRIELELVRGELDSTQTKMVVLRADLETSQTELSDARSKISSLQDLVQREMEMLREGQLTLERQRMLSEDAQSACVGLQRKLIQSNSANQMLRRMAASRRLDDMQQGDEWPQSPICPLAAFSSSARSLQK